MPWSKMSDVPPSIKSLASIASGDRKAKLTLTQANKIGEMYDKLKNKPGIDNAMAIAITNFRKMYKIENGHWVKFKKKIIYVATSQGSHIFYI